MDKLGVRGVFECCKGKKGPQLKISTFLFSKFLSKPGRSCSLIFRSRVGSLVSKKIPSPRFSPGSCPKAPASPPVLFANEYQKPPVLPRFSSQMPPVLPRFFWAPPVLPRFPPGSPPVLPTLYANRLISLISEERVFKAPRVMDDRTFGSWMSAPKCLFF